MNNKGVTVIELLVSFILISMILVGMMNVLYIYRGKLATSNYKKQLIEYKNGLTKDIYEDILTRKIDTVTQNSVRKLTFNFKDGTKKELIMSDSNTNPKNKNITYGNRVYKVYENFSDNANIKKYEMIKFTDNKIILIQDNIGTDIIYHVDININHVDLIDDFGIHLTFVKDK